MIYEIGNFLQALQAKRDVSESGSRESVNERSSAANVAKRRLMLIYLYGALPEILVQAPELGTLQQIVVVFIIVVGCGAVDCPV